MIIHTFTLCFPVEVPTENGATIAVQNNSGVKYVKLCGGWVPFTLSLPLGRQLVEMETGTSVWRQKGHGGFPKMGSVDLACGLSNDLTLPPVVGGHV